VHSRMTRGASMPTIISAGPNLLAQHKSITEPGSPPVLLNHPVQSTVAIDGWKSVLFGLPFLVASIGIVCAALNIISVHGRKNAPDWLIGLIGGFFFSAGAFLIIHGMRGAARRAVYLREAAEHPGEPWLVDHHWHREGIAFSAFNTMLGRFVAALGWNAFLIPFFWVGLNVPGMERVFLVFASLFALIGLVFWGRWLQMLGELFRYGNTLLPAPAKTARPVSSALNSIRKRSPSPVTSSPPWLAAISPLSSRCPQINPPRSLPRLRLLTGRSRFRAKRTATRISKPISPFLSTAAPDSPLRTTPGSTAAHCRLAPHALQI
jgi:hypothetical protein